MAAFAGGLGLYAVATGTRIGASESHDDAAYTLHNYGGLVGMRAHLDEDRRIAGELFVGGASGTVKAPRLSSDASGLVFGTRLSFTPDQDRRLTFSAGAAYGFLDQKGRRNTLTSTSRFDTGSSAYAIQAEVAYLAWEGEAGWVRPAIGFQQIGMRVDGFTETNDATYEGLTVASQSNHASVGTLSVTSGWRLGERVTLQSGLSVSHDFATSGRTVSAGFTGDPGQFSVFAPGLGSTSGTLRLGVESRPTDAMTVGVVGTVGTSDNSSMQSGVSARLNVQF